MVKKFFGLILTAFSVNCYANWSYFGSTADMDVFINEQTVFKSGSIIRAWSLAEFKKPTITGTKAQETYREFDCKNGSSKILKMKTYDKDGKITDSYGFLPDWHSKPQKGSIGDSLQKFYCR